MLEVRPEVREALVEGRPVLALESTVFAHGLPHPRGMETALRMETVARSAGVVPATIGILGGRLVVGLAEDEIRRLAESADTAKVSVRDLGPTLAGGGLGATTVSATLVGARRAGIAVLATGGIGGVHRGGEDNLDISADLPEIGRSPVAVVCSGAKAVLDLERTLEVLETLGVPVVGYGTDELPAFYSRESRLALEHRVDEPEEAARVLAAQWDLGLAQGIVFAHPPPRESAIEAAEVGAWIDAALAAAAAAGVRGKDTTPFLLARVAELSGGRTLAANVALLEANARVAAGIAAAWAGARGRV